MGQVIRAFSIFVCIMICAGATYVKSDEAKDQGRKLFVEKRCYSCHTIDSESAEIDKQKEAFAKEKGVESASEDEGDSIGVDLSDVGKRRDKDYFTEFLKDPRPSFKDTPPCKKNAKKKYRKRFKGTQEEFDSLIAYLMTLKYDSQKKEDFESCLNTE